ncbi:MAG: GNAT family N-acetyltransferase [Chloroflexi bacterium]|nr:GNAT family N-acetyltransferase [Chloroflexota bacterium]
MLELSHIFAEFPTLETERCIMRPFTPADAPAFFEIMRHEQVTRYIGQKPMASVEDAVARLERFQRNYEQQEGLVWAVTLRNGGQLIGNVLFWNLMPAHYRAEVGYVLGPEYWGQGLMTEILRVVLDFGFNTMGLHSIEAQTDPDNAASRRVLEKQGFVLEGHYHENYYDITRDRFTDTTVFSLLVQNWNGRS